MSIKKVGVEGNGLTASTILHCRRNLATALIGVLDLTAASATVADTKPQAGPEGSQSGGGAIAPFPLQKIPGDSLAEVGQKLSDPLSDVWALFTEFNHTWSDGDITNRNYAKSGNDVDDTSHGSILYSVWWNLPKAWQVGFNPTITYNDKAKGDNKWNVPVGLGVSKTVRLGKLPVKFQLSAEKSIVRQDVLDKEWNIRLNVILVIPALVKNPLF